MDADPVVLAIVIDNELEDMLDGATKRIIVGSLFFHHSPRSVGICASR
jgi:hypothetical protein